MTASALPEGGPEARVERTFPALDGLRLLAATAVVVTHATFWAGLYRPDALGRALSHLEVAVPMFFVLSGFLLTRPFLLAAARGVPGPRPAAYLWRRALRILPAYWVLITAALLVLPANAGSGPLTWLRYLTLTQIYTPGWLGDGLTQTWSLCTEVAFYLLLPLLGGGLAWLVRKRPGRPGSALVALAGLAVVGPVVTAVTATLGPVSIPVNLWLPGYTDWFAGGMALALLTVADPSWRPVRAARELAGSLSTCWCAALALFWIASSPLAGPTTLLGAPTPAEAVVRHLLYLLVAVLAVLPLVLGDQRHGGGRRFLATPAMRFLGELSYGLFLFHQLVLSIGYRALGQPQFTGNPFAVCAGAWLGGIALAWACYALVEQPLSGFRGLVPDRRPRHSAAPASTATASTAASTST
jgi:peptidoglycan/LPS O-acetylase OafA/YrhL